MEDPSYKQYVATEVQAALQSGSSPTKASTPAGDVWSLGSLLVNFAAHPSPNTTWGSPCFAAQCKDGQGQEGGSQLPSSSGSGNAGPVSDVQTARNCLAACDGIECADLVLNLLHAGPSQRPSAAAALALPYFDDMRPVREEGEE